jgi:two-component system response regulator YesN
LAGEIFTSHFSWYLLPLSASHVALMVGVRGLTEEKAFAYLGQAARRIAAGLGKGLGVPVHASFGNLRSSAVGIRESYAEAREALDFCFARESGTVLPYADLAVAAAAEGPRPAGLEEEFILSVKLCDRVQCARRIEELERFYRGKGASDPRLIKMDLLEILIHLFDRLGPASEAGEELRTLRISVYAELEKSDSLTDLFGRLKDLSARLMDAVERLRNSSSISRVEKVKELVEAHLADPDLFMDEVASRVFVSPNYLRGIFKQQTGESFVEYLTRRRMETAAELLRDPTIQVQDIAERVGYPNQRYFSVCFKKVHGCSPSEYRSLHARGTRD